MIEINKLYYHKSENGDFAFFFMEQINPTGAYGWQISYLKSYNLIHVFLNDRIQNHETEFMNSLRSEKSNYKKLFNLIFNSSASIKIHAK